jgi:tetratricopeptide (TPR) repeat protein
VKDPKTTKTVIIIFVVVVLVSLAAYWASMRERDRNRTGFAQRIISEGPSETTESIEEVRRNIALYEKRIEQHVADAARTGAYWKILAIRLQDRDLHGEALQALERAIYYTPIDPALHNAIGLSAAVMAKSIHLFPGRETFERDQYFTLAEEAYLRAIELDSRYLRPRYGLAVLYVFELDRPEEAIPHLEQYLQISRNDIDTMFVLARANYMLDNFQAAVELYDRIITLARDPQKRIDAQNNRQTVMERMYGG